MSSLEEALRILRMVVALDPVERDSGQQYCFLCNAGMRYYRDIDPPGFLDGEHDATCPWRLAKELIDKLS